MGLMKAMKAANNYWAMVSCDSGIGTLGPENLIDNRAHKLVISIGTNVITFGKADVQSIDMICATSEWIKYSIILKTGKRYIATFMVLSLSDKTGRSTSLSGTVNTGKKVSMGLLNFEWWMADLLYKEKPVQTAISPVATATSTEPLTHAPSTTQSAAPSTAQSTAPSTAQSAAPSAAQSAAKKAESKTAAPAKTAKATQSKKAVEESQVSREKSALESKEEKNSEDKEKMYLFGLQMINQRSYDVAYNILSKIKGYKDVDELLQQIKDKI